MRDVLKVTVLSELRKHCLGFNDSLKQDYFKNIMTRAMFGLGSKREKWEVGTQELRLFVEAAERMSSAQRHAFTNVLAPRRVNNRGVYK